MTGPHDTDLRQGVRGLLQAVEPPVAPVDAIIRRGRGIRLRRTGAVAGGLVLAGIVAGAALLAPPKSAEPPEPPLPVTVPASGIAGPGGVFASGIADGHPWRLAVQDIADPGYRCIPAVTVNGTDAYLVSPDPGSSADVALGPAAPGIGFAFVQVPADIEALVIDGRESVPAIAATVCGQHYRLVGLAYRLRHPPRLTAGNAAANWPAVYPLPAISAGPAPPPGAPQEDGIWNNVSSAVTAPVRAVLATGTTWSIELIFGAGGACYDFNEAQSPGSPEMGACSPIITPGGPQTIIALPLSYSPAGFGEPTGYAVQVSPRTARLRATVSDGSTQLVTPKVVGGRRYAAFVIGTSLRLERLTWLDASGQAFASTTALPRDGYTQFRS